MAGSSTRVAGYLDIAHRLAVRVAAGDPPPGEALPGVRSLAVSERAGASTVARALERLAHAGVVETAPRRRARVRPDGAERARALLQPSRPLRLAGSDDPALTLLAAACDDALELLAPAGSAGGLIALRDGRADAAVLHLWHAGGEWNAPYARMAFRGRPGLLVHLWSREQGLLLPPGNPAACAAVGDLRGLVVARRPAGAGTRALEARLLREAGLPADALRGPELGSHLEVAIAVASGVADAGMGVRAAAVALGLDFVALAREPFELALPRADRDRLAPVRQALAAVELRAAIGALGGYDLEGSGTEREL
jgi:putative molybdopterin biosynthesis protein